MNLQTAISGVKALSSETFYDSGAGFTCTEVEALVDLFTVLHLNDHAESLLAGHIEEDEPGDLHYIETDDDDDEEDES